MLVRIRLVTLAALVAFSLAPAAPAQGPAAGDLRGANYVYPRPGERKTARKAARAPQKYRRKGEQLVAGAADARIGVTFWRARPDAGDAVAATRDIVQASGETKAWSLVRLGGEPELELGAQFRVGIETLRPGFLYVVNRPLRSDGSAGAPYLIFPTRRIRGGDNRMRAGRMVMLPAPPDEPPFETRDTRGDLAAEELVVIVSPVPLEVEVRDDRYELDPALVDGWLSRWSTRAETYELLGGAGAGYTPAEKAAATSADRLLTSSDPLPQVVHRVVAKPGDPALLRLTLRVTR
jgi:hypothetical protein